MTTDLRQQICELIETGARPISPDEITSRRPAGEGALRSATTRYRRLARYRLSPRTVMVAAGVTAVGCAGAVVAVQLGSAPGRPARDTNPPSGTVLTMAAVRQVLNASSAALSRSGQAQIRFRDVLRGGTLDYGTTDVTYSGHNINVARHDRSPGSRPTTYVQRLVDGQYYYNADWPPNPGWEHVTGAHPTWRQLSAADPRRLLRELTPAAWFERAGHITSLSLWVDGHGVVHQINATLAAPGGGPHTVLSVLFIDIGRSQTVRAPAPVRAGRG